ncbi:hypothetical protein HDU83_002379 [Entophlyctis luteolus]|nr:hypothetical protein HDU83_002379 [Entophlyctis luteolus]
MRRDGKGSVATCRYPIATNASTRYLSPEATSRRNYYLLPPETTYAEATARIKRAKFAQEVTAGLNWRWCYYEYLEKRFPLFGIEQKPAADLTKTEKETIEVFAKDPWVNMRLEDVFATEEAAAKAHIRDVKKAQAKGKKAHYSGWYERGRTDHAFKRVEWRSNAAHNMREAARINRG